MDAISRRHMLAATAAGGLLTTNIMASAQSGPFQSKLGTGELREQRRSCLPVTKSLTTIPKTWPT
jgi:oxalate decarboxylase